MTSLEAGISCAADLFSLEWYQHSSLPYVSFFKAENRIRSDLFYFRPENSTKFSLWDPGLWEYSPRGKYTLAYECRRISGSRSSHRKITSARNTSAFAGRLIPSEDKISFCPWQEIICSGVFTVCLQPVALLILEGTWIQSGAKQNAPKSDVIMVPNRVLALFLLLLFFSVWVK